MVLAPGGVSSAGNFLNAIKYGGGTPLQLTSTPDAPASLRDRVPSLVARVNHPLAAAVVAFLGWLGYVLARLEVWAHGHPSLFVVAGGGSWKIGHTVYYAYTKAHQLPPSLMIADPNSAGYDGQFYYRLALNPFNWSKTAYGITMDQPYRYTRIGYPLVSWVVSFGQHDLVPVALIAVNLVSVAAIAYLGGIFARDGGRHALWGVLFAAYFGLAISVGRDTGEPLAEAFMLGGLLAYRRGRWVLSGAAFAFAAITRETILFAAAALACVRLVQIARRKVKPGWPDVAWLAPAVAFGLDELAAKFVLKGYFAQSSLGADTSRNLSTPFAAMFSALHYDFTHISTGAMGWVDYNLLEYATLAIFIVAGLAVIVVTTAPIHERIAFVFFLFELGTLSSQIWSSNLDFSDGRSMIEPFLFALILLLATPKRYLNRYRLALIAAAAAPALVMVTRRRILFM